MCGRAPDLRLTLQGRRKPRPSKVKALADARLGKEIGEARKDAATDKRPSIFPQACVV